MISLAYENAYDIAVILSGDGDYKALIELVKSKGKKVWVVSFKDSLSSSLRECADKVLIIDNMIEFFNRKHIQIKFHRVSKLQAASLPTKSQQINTPSLKQK